jgi:hypothetical protein
VDWQVLGQGYVLPVHGICPRTDCIGIIDKSAIEGQKQYHDDLDKGMRAHMKAHPTEFFPEGASAEDAEPAEDESLTDAEKYALQTRKNQNRQSQDYSALQGALDSVLSGFKAIFSGLSTAIASISDLLSLGEEGSKVVILGILVLILVGSNVYTYVAYRPTSPELRQYRRSGGQDGDLGEAVRLLLQNANANGKGQGLRSEGGGSALGPREETQDLMRILDDVERRTAKLRGQVMSSTEYRGNVAELD